MLPVTPIIVEDVADARLDVFARLTEPQLRNKLSPEKGLFIAESPKVIMTALEAGLKPVSILCEPRHIEGDAAAVISKGLEVTHGQLQVFTSRREVLESLTGYKLTRGVLCAMTRPAPTNPLEILNKSARVCILDGVCDTTNIGAIFRSAAALGVDGVLLGPTCCDPLNRRAVRVSMGSVFLVDWAWLGEGLEQGSDIVRNAGFKTVAMALRKNSIDLADSALHAEPKLAIVMGTEGDGLADPVISTADYVVKIPMSHGVDSLNVAAASAVAFWELCARPRV